MSRKDKINFLISMLLLTIFIAILILTFCWFCYELPIDFPGTVGEWITALSSLAGGVLTLGGVWWTIKDTNNKRREDLAIQYKPYLVLEKSVTFTIEEINYSYTYYNDTFDLNKTLDLKNIGRGEAIISSIYISNLESKTNLIDIQTQIDSY